MTAESNTAADTTMGVCCYGGQRTRAACGSCAAWRPLESVTSENQVVCAVCDGEKPFDEHAAGCPLHPDVRPSNLVSRLRNEYPQEGDALPMSASLLMEEAADEIERLRAIARPGDAAAFEEYAAARGVPFETGAGLIAALHLLAGQVASPIHAETARRAIAALGGGAAKAIETNDPPRELLPLLRKAVAALDAGTAISPTSYIHDRLKELLAEKAVETFDSSEAELESLVRRIEIICDATSRDPLEYLAESSSEKAVETTPVQITVAACEYLQGYFFEVHGHKYSLEDARIVLHTALSQPEKANEKRCLCAPGIHGTNPECPYPTLAEVAKQLKADGRRPTAANLFEDELAAVDVRANLRCGTCGELHVEGGYYNHNHVPRNET